MPRRPSPRILRALALGIACFCFWHIAAGVPKGLPPPTLDREVADWFHQRSTPTMTSIAEAVSFLGDTPFIAGCVVAGTLFFFVRRDWRRLLALLLAVPGGALLNFLLKGEFHRARPWFPQPLIAAGDYSFPSGHTMLAVLLYGLLCLFLLSQPVAGRWRLMAPLATTLLIVAIGVARLYLGVHFLSDVLGALAAGTAWLTVVGRMNSA